MVSVACPSSVLIGSMTNTHSLINPVRTNQRARSHSGSSVCVLSMCSCDFSPHAVVFVVVFVVSCHH